MPPRSRPPDDAATPYRYRCPSVRCRSTDLEWSKCVGTVYCKACNRSHGAVYDAKEARVRPLPLS